MSQATCALHGCTTATDVEWLSCELLIYWPFLSLRDDSGKEMSAGTYFLRTY
ncbi:hypothetical protein [Vibrio vulnificus]|uniref:hypothetical protein n=1 Tax=Vibrio vulnificus TaxID=672 RepID=UPI0013EE4081|nr:hypothetical protein [Vibrio vulnificus]HDY7890171.1 hypothetical protein [Vibrio vulnificus]